MYPKLIQLTKKTPKGQPDEVLGECSIQWSESLEELKEYYGEVSVVAMVKAALNNGFRGKIRQLLAKQMSFEDIQIFIDDKKWCPPGRAALSPVERLIQDWYKATPEVRKEFAETLRADQVAKEIETQ